MPPTTTARRLPALVVLLASGVGLSASAQPAPAPHLTVVPVHARLFPSSAGPMVNLVAVGDSVPAGSGCGCTPFPVHYARSLAALTGRKVAVSNDGMPGLTSAGLLARLQDGQGVGADIAAADITTITIGANDFDYTQADPSCPGGAIACFDSQLAELAHQLYSVLTRIAFLRHNSPTTVLLTGYWDIWEDGQVAAFTGQPYVAIGDELTWQVNQRLQQAANASGAIYVDLTAPFRGRSGKDDDTRLLAGDGDHPNAAGHQTIAQALLAATPTAVAPAPRRYHSPARGSQPSPASALSRKVQRRRAQPGGLSFAQPARLTTTRQ